METKKELTCIGCPMGCSITVTMEDGEVKTVTGNTCGIGDKYARKEVTNPERTVCSTAIVSGGDLPRVSCKTKTDIPKSKIFEVMKEINEIKVEAPVNIGDVLLDNVAGTGVPVVATKDIKKVS
ncbi:MAG: DUF1667 domain-containing protein [Lachnospiraceae bacterium]|uniref:DUF1667 domain-containing protein n=1 Tax=Candidatus Weimeria bifida TaxID=2599074 RepID=A0A6N7IZQ0_9FIRM|nr:DUF1667 domain-containing protein [Candidatus Weimeria bifida]RRF95562.1 MAG: DUF1667 domain-containing protein [Lachnospiraceae bacterium]